MTVPPCSTGAHTSGVPLLHCQELRLCQGHVYVVAGHCPVCCPEVHTWQKVCVCVGGGGGEGGCTIVHVYIHACACVYTCI